MSTMSDCDEFASLFSEPFMTEEELMDIEMNNIELSIQNIVATVSLDIQLDLIKLSNNVRIAEYNPSRFAAVCCRMNNPKTTALMFKSGNMVCAGAKSEQESKLAVRKYCLILTKLGYNISKITYRLQNMVASCSLGFQINIDKLCNTLGNECSYEPGTFPGLKYKLSKPKITMLIFVSGKVVFTGGKHYGQIVDSFLHIYPIMRAHKKIDYT